MTAFLTSTLQTLFIIAVVLLVADFFYVFWIFAKISKLLFDTDPEQWSRYGRPPGLFWYTPPTYGSFGELMLARWRQNWLFIQLLFSTPMWARHDPEATGLIRRFRIAVFYWPLSLLLIMVVAMTAPN